MFSSYLLHRADQNRRVRALVPNEPSSLTFYTEYILRYLPLYALLMQEPTPMVL
jgi:hypothetical protein